MPARIDLPAAPALSSLDRLTRRAAVWSMFLREIYGPPRNVEMAERDADDLPDVEALGSLSRAQIVARPHVLRRLIAPLVLTRPPHFTAWSADFRELVLAAVRDQRSRPATFEEALAWLRRWAHERFGALDAGDARPAVRAGLRLLDPDDLIRAEPSEISVLDGVFTLGRYARVKAPLEGIRDVINPLNWMRLGEFFEYVGPIEGHYVERRDGWSGLFEERFVVGFGPFALSTCHPTLRVDFTFDESRVRADYALLYEQDDQLECDDGYLEATTIPGEVGWCRYYVEKSTKFRSPISNLLSPVVMAVFLESSLSSIEDLAHEHFARGGAV